MVKYISSLLSSINRIRRVIEVVITGLTRNQVIPNGTEGSNPSLSAKNKGYSVCYTLYFFVDKTARDSNPYNLLQDEVLSKEVYNRIVCGANRKSNITYCIHTICCGSNTYSVTYKKRGLIWIKRNQLKISSSF